MGILNMFNPPAEEKSQQESEKRQMGFQREQNSLAVTVPEEQTEIMNQEGKSDLLKWQQDLDPELETITFRLTGWVKRDGEWVKTDNRPLCNELFMNDVVAPQLEPFLSKNLINSNLTEERILKNLKHTSNDITANMCDGYDVYGIDFKNYDLILRVLKNTMKNSSFRALNGWTKKTDSTIFKKLESSFDNANQPQQKGLLGFKK